MRTAPPSGCAPAACDARVREYDAACAQDVLQDTATRWRMAAGAANLHVMTPEDRQRAAEARRALERVEQDSTPVLGSAMRRAADHFSAKDADKEGVGDDRIEVWGRRIGRALAVVFFVVLVVNLFTRWFF